LNCRIASESSNSAFVSATSDKRVTGNAPMDSPGVADDPERNSPFDSVTNDDNFVIKAVQIFLTSWIAEDAVSE
jgi:hypothetical protein